MDPAEACTVTPPFGEPYFCNAAPARAAGGHSPCAHHETPALFADKLGFGEAFEAWPNLKTWGDVRACLKQFSAAEFVCEGAPAADEAQSAALYKVLQERVDEQEPEGTFRRGGASFFSCAVPAFAALSACVGRLVSAGKGFVGVFTWFPCGGHVRKGALLHGD